MRRFGWWFLVLLTLVFFVPAWSQIKFNPADTQLVIKQVLIAPYIYRYPVLFVVSKLVFLALLVGLIWRPRCFWRPFAAVAALLNLAVALFQNVADTANYGFTVLTGNLLLMLVVAGFWGWEAIVPQSRLELPNLKRLWVAAVALFAFWMPVNPSTAAPDFSPTYFLTSGSLLTGCMLIPVLLAVLLLYYPTVNRVLLRVTAYVGTMFGIVNMLTWFVLDSEFWWMGVVHLPLMVISLYGFILARPIKDHPGVAKWAEDAATK